MADQNQNTRKNKWFDPAVHDTGWDKDMDAGQRRMLMLKAHGGDNLASARAMQALSNVTKDEQTREEAAKDAIYFIKEYQGGRKHYVISRRMPRITARTAKLR